jgi:riboflavin synthase
VFTGLVSDIGVIECIEPREQLRRVRIMCSYPAATIAEGASIACGGPCLTAVAIESENGRTAFEVDVGAETLALTTARDWTPGVRVNLERSLKLGDELGGHMVTGHIDGVAGIISAEDFDGMKRFVIRAPRTLAKFIAQKGSISLDGTSLTVNSVEDDVFSVLLIPHTLKVTTWGDRGAGDEVNLEVDLMARYAARLADDRRLTGNPT